MNYRFELPKNIKRIVLKLGSVSVSKATGGLDRGKFKKLLVDIINLHQSGVQVVVVCSGAINIGRPFLPTKKTEKVEIAHLQACSSIGQPILMEAFRKYLQRSEIHCAQVLLTHEDFKNRRRYLNSRNTLLKLLEHKVIPILNENDSVSFAEITLGDNDQLAAMVCEQVDGDFLLIMTEADGLYDKNPEERGAQSIPNVAYAEKMTGVKLGAKTGVGRGGMQTKLQAVKKLTTIGIPVVMASYTKKSPIMRALTENVGTFFAAKNILAKNRWKHWIFTTEKGNATISIDHGAYLAMQKNASLLPVGIIKVNGHFKRGDTVAVKYKKRVIGIGLSEYDALEIEKIIGLKRPEIVVVLGHCPSSVVIHRDNYLNKD